MRTISFIDNIEFDYNGSISSKSLTLGDVDNDKVVLDINLTLNNNKYSRSRSSVDSLSLIQLSVYEIMLV